MVDTRLPIRFNHTPCGRVWETPGIGWCRNVSRILIDDHSRLVNVLYSWMIQATEKDRYHDRVTKKDKWSRKRSCPGTLERLLKRSWGTSRVRIAMGQQQSICICFVLSRPIEGTYLNRSRLKYVRFVACTHFNVALLRHTDYFPLPKYSAMPLSSAKIIQSLINTLWSRSDRAVIELCPPRKNSILLGENWAERKTH